MTIDLWVLLMVTGLAWALIMADATPSLLGNGVAWSAGNRENSPEKEGLHGRVHRASMNMNENFPLFATVVLIAHVSGEADAMSALGCQIFLAGRLAHAAVYVVGVHYLRTGAWCVSIGGMGLVVAALF